MAAEEYVDPTADSTAQAVEQAEPSKEEVGWMFVHQYYTILNKEPQILYRFYTKNSTLCHGDEGESVMPSVGQIEIHKKIKQLDFQDCKVLVSNVDSQSAADGGIVVQVLGELSNKGQPSQKFVQTFCLAPQAKGYYVHNDIFRYLKEDTGTSYDNEEATTTAPAPPQSQPVEAAAPAAPVPATISQDNDQPAATAAAKDSSLFADKIGEEKAAALAALAAAANTSPAPQVTEPPKEAVKVAQPPPPSAPTAPATTITEVSSASGVSSTSPSVAPTPTPAETKPAAPAKETTAPPAVPAPEQVESVSKVPTSWAALAAKNRAAEKISIAPENAVAAATTAAAAAAAAAAAPTTTTTTSSTGAATAPSTTSPSAPASTATTNGTPAAVPVKQQQTGAEAGFQQTNGKGPTEEKKRRRGPINFSELHSAYIKHVTDKVDEVLLREALEKFGKLDHYEVSRAKNCAFVDFATAGALKAALDQNILRVGTETVSVQERRRGGALQKNQSTGGRGGGGQYNNNNTNTNNPNAERKGGAGSGNRPPRNPNRNKRIPNQTEQ